MEVQHHSSFGLGQVGSYNIAEQLFWDRYLADQALEVRSYGWSSNVIGNPDLLPKGTVVRTGGGAFTVVGQQDGLQFMVMFHDPNNWYVVVASSRGREACDTFVDQIREIAPEIEERDDAVPISFWSLNSHGDPTTTIRMIEAHKWDAIRDNYPIDVRADLDALMKVQAPERSGKLVLWHGPPGTGKTNCIRALADEWRGWCSVDYVVDPEQLFRQAHYMMSALVNNTGNVFNNPKKSERWRLVVIEDSGDFLREDAHDRTGWGFGRLLNLTDGLVGQGLKLIILITTNEPFTDLHPAISRSGRCLAHLHFSEFPAPEASKWLDEKVYDKMTLAAMYEKKSERQPQIAREREEFRSGLYV
jgi:hypothetical protein